MTKVNTTFNLTVTPATAYRYNAGHYASMQRRPDARTQAQMTAATVSGITKGFLKRYSWAAVETSQGVYDFSEIASDLAYCLARGLKLIVMFEDRTYGGTFGSDNPAPTYLALYSPANIDGGFTVAKWDPTVTTRFRAMLSAFAAAYGSHASLEGVMQEETALGLTTTTLASTAANTPYVAYTPELYRDALIANITHWRSVCPTVRWFFYMNFMTGNASATYLDAVVQAHKPAIVICGPDAEESNTSLSNAFDIYRNNKATCPIMCHLSTQVYQSTPTPTSESMYTFATADLGANYICSVFQGTGTASWDNLVVPMMNAHPTFNVESW